MNLIRVSAVAAALTAAVAAAPGADAPAGGAARDARADATMTAALSPTMREALQGLSAEDFKTRQAALLKLELALGDQMRALAASDDPEVQSQLAQLLEFNDGLTRWTLEVIKLPAAQRKAQLEFGLQPEVLPIMAKVFSTDVEKRVAGVKALGKQSSPEAMNVLARLLDDPQRAVYVAAMEAVWDKKPTDAVVDSLWNRAVESGFSGAQPPAVDPRRVAALKLAFRGMPLPGGGAFMGIPPQVQDATIACDVLINLQAPQVNEKLKSFVASLEKMAENNQWLMNNSSDQVKSVYRLVAAYKSKEALALFYRIATAPARERGSIQVGADKVFWTNRTGVLASVIEATGQKPEDYQLRPLPQMGLGWAVPSEEDENKAVKKMQEWMAANGDKWEWNKVVEPVTRPAPDAAEKPPLPPNQGPAIIQVHPQIPGGIQIPAPPVDEK